ncbi:MAG: aminotransferase class I/II-fold pyridoxal phosphate-dependent enzyme [Paenibacillaceae bacterium]
MDHTRAPLYDRMLEHRSLQSTSFHVPGHKDGVGLDPLAEDTLKAVMSIDLTELTGLDDLHQPEGVIREAEQLAADCFGADHTYLLVGGSTVGNLAMILSMCQTGQNDLFIVQRNVHKSIIHGLMLAGAQAVFLAPQVDAATGIAAGVALSDMEAALRQYPNAVGVLLTNPNYYGMGIDLHAIIECVHASGKPVFVDEAHGAHYGFHPDIPESALSAGADGVVQSTHKMLTAMTMGAMLHLQGNRIDPQSVRRHLSMVQSSSPSYPILASLDLSRRQLQIQGRLLLNQALEAVTRLHRGMAQMPWFQLVGQEAPAHTTQAYSTLDPLKITISDRTGTLGGFDLQRQLELHRCYPEMADPHYVVLAFSLVTRGQDIERLLDVLLTISTEFRLDKQEPADHAKKYTFVYPPISLPVPFSFNSNQANHASYTELDPPCLEVPIEDAVGFATQQAITPYPPGIPLLYPGERVSVAAAKQLQIWIQSGARIHGLTDNGNILIYRNHS